MTRLGRIRFDWQIGLIGLSAFIGFVVAYTGWRATVQFGIVVISIVVYLIYANLADPLVVRGQPRSILAAITAAPPAVIAVIFLLTNDWARWIGKVPALDPVLRLLADMLPSAGVSLNPNVIGGSLAALLPLQVFALRHARRSISVPLIALTFIALLLSQTRGAWLVLILVAGMWALWQSITKRVADERRARWSWSAVVIGCGVAVIGLLSISPIGDQVLGLGGDRRAIWHNSIDLIGDYPLTGAGLAGFEMVYSTYSLLLHVGHTVHAHNLWLDMWLNQGVLGVIALAGMIVNAVWPKPASPWRMPALLTLGVILLHSLVDDPYYGYGGVALPIIFIPLGLLVRSGVETAAESRRSRRQPALIVWAGAATIMIVGVVTPAGRATVEANLGALLQTRAELAQYQWPETPIQDELRRPGHSDLIAAEAHFQAALALDPANVVANRRLGQIELAREQYETACARLTVAYQAAPQQRATRQLLGECKAITGQSDEAAALWKTIDVSQSQLNVRHWWYDEYLQDHERASQLQAAMNILTRE
jgi:O-antigen ligase